MTDFRKLFKPEYFETKSFNYIPNTLVQTSKVIKAKEAAELAQSILNEALDKATVVYGYTGPNYGWSKYQISTDTHKALLIQVEEIKQCEHKIDDVVLFSKDDSFGYAYHKCSKCKKEVIPTGFKVRE